MNRWGYGVPQRLQRISPDVALQYKEWTIPQGVSPPRSNCDLRVRTKIRQRITSAQLTHHHHHNRPPSAWTHSTCTTTPTSSPTPASSPPTAGSNLLLPISANISSLLVKARVSVWAWSMIPHRPNQKNPPDPPPLPKSLKLTRRLRRFFN